MYKIMYNNVVIDVLKVIRYGKYIPATGRVIATDKSIADCIVASNLKDRYLLKGVPIPEGCKYLQVSIVEIDGDEYDSFVENDTNAFENGIKSYKRHKIEELRQLCSNNIMEGLQIELSDNKLHHFTMTIEDQLNLLEIRHLISIGETTFIYHECGGEYKEFSVDDMQKIINETFKHKQKHLLHFNSLKKKIQMMSNIEEISKVTYCLN